MTYAFSFDSKFCSGCKACQAACKDKNNLPTGVLWRRVYEVSGGSWQHEGDAWTSSVFTYNLSISCNHCAYPKCAGVCPADAYTLREDGIVFLDTTKCAGCGYCAWACPYGAPQYNPQAGHMTKCDFCADQLEQGLPPACVAACPLRVLEFGEAEDHKGIPLWDTPSTQHPFPLPAFSHTQPRLAIQPHPAMERNDEKVVANTEEVQPRQPSKWEDAPLMAFTLLGQLAVGGFWAMLWMFPPFWSSVQVDGSILHFLPLLLIGVCLGLGMLASFTHLGTKKKAWKMLLRLKKSWLSREILFALLFGLGWLYTSAELIFIGKISPQAAGITTALGLGLVYSMAQVYRLASMPGWNTWRTNAAFLVSAFLLGSSVMMSMAAFLLKNAGIPAPQDQWVVLNSILFSLLLLQLILIRGKQTPHSKLRIGLILIGTTFTVFGILQPSSMTWLGTTIFILIFLEEGLGRWSFYKNRT